jgi:hypothetical protein
MIREFHVLYNEPGGPGVWRDAEFSLWNYETRGMSNRSFGEAVGCRLQVGRNRQVSPDPDGILFSPQRSQRAQRGDHGQGTFLFVVKPAFWGYIAVKTVVRVGLTPPTIADLSVG